MVAIVVAPSPIILASTQPHVVIPIYVFNFSCSIEVEQKLFVQSRISLSKILAV